MPIKLRIVVLICQHNCLNAILISKLQSRFGDRQTELVTINIKINSTAWSCIIHGRGDILRSLLHLLDSIIECRSEEYLVHSSKTRHAWSPLLSYFPSCNLISVYFRFAFALLCTFEF
jgi:hypothetical protein